MAEATKKRSVWKTGCAVVAVLVIVVGAVGVFMANRWLDNTDYKRLAEEALTDAIGMPTVISDLDVVIFPTPAIRADRVRIGSDTFYATVDTITARGDLGALSEKTIRITEATLVNPVITLPQDFGEVDTWIDSFGGDGGGTDWQVSINRITIEDAGLRQSEADDWVVFSGQVDDLLGDGRFTIAGSAPVLGAEATLEGEGRFRVDGGMTANVTIANGLLTALDESLQSFGNAQATAQIVSEDWAVWEGALELTAEDAAVTAAVQWAEGILAFNDIALTGDGIEVRGDATRHPDGGVGALIRTGHVDSDRLAAMVRDATDGAINLTGALGFENVHAGMDSEGAILLSEGNVTLAGAELHVDGKRALQGGRLDATVAENALVIDSLTAEGIDLKGSVMPLAEWAGARIALSGTATLSDGLLAPLDLGPGVRNVRGVAKIENASATIDGAGLPDDLVVAGTLSDGAVAIDFGDSFAENFTGINGGFTTNGKVVQVDVRGGGSQMGAFRLKSDIDTVGQNINGTLSGTAAQLGAPAYWNPWARETLEPVLASYGDVTVEWGVQLPTEQRKEIAITAAIPAEGPRHLHGDVYLAADGEGAYELSLVEVNAGFPSATLNPMVAPMAMEGWTNLSFTKPANAETFEVVVDLSGADLDLPPYVHLDADSAGGGLPRVRVTGATDVWAADQLIIELAPGASANGTFTESGVVFRDFEIQLANVAPYFPVDTLADGTIRGDIVSTPLDVALKFEDVRLAPGGGLDPVAVDGALRVTETALDIPGLDVRGANSNLRIEGREQDGVWTGSVTGRQLDASAVRVLVEQWTTGDDSAGEESGADGGGIASEPMRIAADVAIETVLYRPAEAARTLTLTNVSGQVKYDEAGFRLDNLNATPYTGAVTGAVAYGGEDMLDVQLNLQGVDARAVDELFFIVPRNLSGSIDGDVALRMPLDDDPAAGMTGRIDLKAAKGTLGSMGIATQILDLLRTVQIWNIFGGWKRENGLIYDKLTTTMTADSGLMRIEQLSLKNNYLHIKGNGTVDFAKRASKVPIEIEVLEGVFKPVQAVPVVGQTAGKVGVIAAEMTGSPYDPKVAVTGTRGFQNLGDQIRNAGDAIEEEVVNRVIQGIGNLLKRRN